MVKGTAGRVSSEGQDKRVIAGNGLSPAGDSWAGRIPSSLPRRVMETIIIHAITDDPAARMLFLAQLGPQWHQAALSAVYGHLTLVDDDSIFLLAGARGFTETSPASGPGGISCPVRTLLLTDRDRLFGPCTRKYAEAVRHLTVLPASPNPSSDEDVQQTVARLPSSLEENTLFHLMSALTNLQVLEWKAKRTLPRSMGVVIKGLRKLERIVVDGHADPGAPLLGDSRRRWDCPQILQLSSDKLTQIVVSDLSLEGVRNLGRAIADLPGLLHLKVIASPFLDDQFFTDVGTYSKRLQTFKIIRMSGTKVTDKGLKSLLDATLSLTHLELTEFEGRLTRKAWTHCQLPASMMSLVIRFAEDGHHHSWTPDHLDSLDALFGPTQPSLGEFVIERVIPIEALTSGQHEEIPCEEVVRPRAIPSALVQALSRDTRSIRTLILDFFSCSFDQARIILESCSVATHISLMIDLPIDKFIAQALGLSSDLRALRLSVSPSALSLLQLKPTTTTLWTTHMPATPAASPERKLAQASTDRLSKMPAIDTPPTSPSRALNDISHAKSASLTSPINIDIMPSQKDLKRIKKRATELEMLEWYGRGGMGRWVFVTTTAKGKLKKTEIVTEAANLPVVIEERGYTLEASHGLPLADQRYVLCEKLGLFRESSLVTEEAEEGEDTAEETEEWPALPVSSASTSTAVAAAQTARRFSYAEHLSDKASPSVLWPSPLSPKQSAQTIGRGAEVTRPDQTPRRNSESALSPNAAKSERKIVYSAKHDSSHATAQGHTVVGWSVKSRGGKKHRKTNKDAKRDAPSKEAKPAAKQ
ncbi:hypothetical protein E5Q_02488 [Mixia osmundae IAM 14324]|uniref:Uncharacterized protein n=1 Tax=Mixia osmundae (strain CBS 9802 / IAM 14324 / JCM 22182 / KY 12970) TaxID=764103 RepID=G7DZ21_MIXOS|nr:hypothetical protein E5Q_02488 [Mixia osmundae IAM 14324]